MTIVENLLGAIIAIPLLAVSLAHFMWAAGRRWPLSDEKLLARAVVGTQGIERMPPKLFSFGVAVFTLASCILALSVADHDSGRLWLDLIGVVLGLIFLARGLVGYSDWWIARTPEEPFRPLDKKNFSPFASGAVLALSFWLS